MVPVLGVVTQVFLRLLSVFETSWCAPTPTARAYPGTSAPVPVREARRGRAYFYPLILILVYFGPCAVHRGDFVLHSCAVLWMSFGRHC